MIFDFLPVSRDDMIARDWYYYDFLLITGDAYVDHPSFGVAVIGRVLEKEGYRVAILPQPDFNDSSEIAKMGKPRYATLITAGNLDSMVAHYTVSKRIRSEDYYSPGKKAGKRPDRAVTVYSKLAREAFPDIPIIIGGLEASLRRFAHYDYWDDKVHAPILQSSGADMLVYGMGEKPIVDIAKKLAKKANIGTITDVRGTAFFAQDADSCVFPFESCPSFDDVKKSREEYAFAAMIQHNEHDPVRGNAVIQECDNKVLIVNPPPDVPTAEELDRIYALAYTREVHPMYGDMGGVSAINEVQFSVIHNRGCFGACNFCALAFHQGRIVASRSHESVVSEVEKIAKHPDFKGNIHDVGGPTANFRKPSCKHQLEIGMCTDRKCLAPPCENLDVDHTDYLKLLRKVSAVEGVKKVFIRSGIRFDYLMLDKNGEFLTELVKHHVSGQLKVAPEHCVDSVLNYMGKPENKSFENFSDKYQKLNQRYSKRQFLVPYLISSHPGCTLDDAIEMAEYLNATKRYPEQVQDFYPTPGTLSTCMYYTAIDPRTMKPVHVPKTKKEKAMQRALLQSKNPKNRDIVKQALKEAGRQDLIGYGKHCLVRP